MANAIRMLAVDAVEKAKSGHPGAPMGMADIAEVLWNRHLRHNPANPHWPNRDRFVLSNGHGSMLIYALLHLTGYDLPMDELKKFRQLHSKTAGHPEFGITPGVETTTGPLGQGISQRGGHGAGREAAGGRVQPRGRRHQLRHRRPLHLRLPGRRLHDGRHQPRGLFAGRHAAPVQADRVLRRQRHLDRRPCGRLVHRRHAGPLCRLWLERDSRCGRPRSRGARRSGAQRPRAGQPCRTANPR